MIRRPPGSTRTVTLFPDTTLCRALGLVLGPMMEENFRRTLVIADGEFTVFFTRPISASLLFLALLMVVMLALPAVRRKQREVVLEEEDRKSTRLNSSH